MFSAGPPSASIVLVGEQPGDQEDRRGLPFVGPAGQLLVRAIKDAGIDPATVYRTNAVKHFRFEQRGTRRIHKTPEVHHVVACHPWLHAELGELTPGIVVALGATAGRSVFGRPVKVGAERGQVLEGAIPDSPARSLLTAHPSAVLACRATPATTTPTPPWSATSGPPQRPPAEYDSRKDPLQQESTPAFFLLKRVLPAQVLVSSC